MLEDDARRKKPPVCIDGRLDATRATGIASYARAMRAALTATGDAPWTLTDDERGRFGRRASAREVAMRRMRGLLPVPVRLGRRDATLWASDVFRLAQARFATTGRLLRLVAPERGGIMHWTYPIPAWIDGWVNLYTVHDVIPLTDPTLSPIAAAPLRRRLRAIARRADRFITVSAHARSAIVSTLDLSNGFVVDCGGAVDVPADGVSSDLPAGLEVGSYYLFCGLDEPRKNLPRLIAAWRASGTRRRLVLVGPAHAPATDADILVLPYQPRPVLMALIASARALLFPSLAEGLGLPIIEAMALGTPVLTSNRGAMAETAGGAALSIDPTDLSSIAAGIASLDRDDALCRALQALGHDRADSFTPERFGERLRAVHDEFAGDSRLAG